MGIEKLTEEMTEKISGGSKRKVQTITRKLIEVKEVECMSCAKSFKIVITYDRPVPATYKEYAAMQNERRTCPHCNFVNFHYQVFKTNVIYHRK